MAAPRNRLAAIALAIAAAWTMAPALADDLGTLFHTPKERADLDRMRRGESLPVTPGQGPQKAYVHPDPVVTGYVKRSDGKSTVFIDQEPYPLRNEKLQELLDPRAVRKHVPYREPPPEVPAVSPGAPAPPAAADAPTSRSGNRPKT